MTIIEFRGAPATFAVIREITDRKEAEAKLRRREEIYRRAIQSAEGVTYQLRLAADGRSGSYEFMTDEIERLV